MNRPTSRKRRRQLVAPIALIGALTLASCSNSNNAVSTKDDTKGTAASDENVAVDQPGVTDTEITVGGVASTTNPLGMTPGSAFDGVQAYFNMVNDAGGIYGRKLVLGPKRDDKLSNNSTQVKALLEEDDVFAILPVASVLLTGVDDLVASGVPTFAWGIDQKLGGTEAEPKANLFGHAGSFICGEGCVTPFFSYVAMDNKLKTAGLIGYTQSKTCVDGQEESVAKWADQSGLKVGFKDSALTYGVTDLSVQVTRMKEAGVDVIWPCMDFQGVVTLAKEMKKQDLDATLVMVNSYNPELTAEFGDLFEGDYTFTYFAPVETEDPPKGLIDFKEQMDKAGFDINENAMVGWINAAQFVSGLTDAGPEFTQQKVVDAINEQTDFTADGFLYGIDWTVQHWSLPKFCAGAVQVKDSEFVPAYAEPGKPFICWEDRETDDLDTAVIRAGGSD